jgi:hypothetical protein
VELEVDVEPVAELPPAPLVERVGPVVDGGGRLDCVGIATVLNKGFDVDGDMVASGPMVKGTLTIAQSSATAEKVSTMDQ